MKDLIYIFFLGLLLSSCAKQHLAADADSGQMVEMKLRISTKANVVDDKISNVRIIVVNKHGDVKFNEVKSVTSIEDDFIAVSRVGINDFYVVCNETAAMTTALNGITKGSDIDAIKISYNSEINSSPLVMYGEMRGVEVVSTGDEDPAAYTVEYTDANGVVQTGKKLPIAVKRLAAKVSLSFVKNTSDFTVSDITIKVVKMPKYSYLKEGKEYDDEIGALTIVKNAQGELLFDNSAVYDAETLSFKYENESVVEIEDIYIPEYILTSAHQGDVGYQTAIIVSAKCTTNEGRAIIGNWRIGLMDMSNRLPRNDWYKIAATISGMGAIGLYAEIKEVTQYDVPVNWKPIEGLTIVGNRTSDYNSDGTNKNTNIWNDYSAYSGVLKVYHSAIGYTDILFKYGSVIATRSPESQDGSSFDPTQDIAWCPGIFTSSIASWADIPYSNSGDILSGQSDVAKGLGDPCKLVALSAEQIAEGVVDNKIWHMATPEEYNRLIEARDDVTGNTNGYSAFHSLIIPNTRMRNESGVLAQKEGKGAYWSSQAGQAFESVSSTNTASIVSYSDLNLSRGYTVRCVRNTIPESYMRVVNNSNSIDYKGGTATFSIESNLPYWKATLITPENIQEGETLGTGTDYDELTFVGNDYGKNNDKFTVQLPFYKTGRTFKIRIEGTGYDGRKFKEIVTLTQYNFSWSLSCTSFSPALPDRLPGAGFNSTAIIEITPNDPRIPIPTDKPYYIWITATRRTVNQENVIFNSADGTDGGLGLLIESGKYKYEIPVKIPASDNIDATMVTLILNSNLASYHNTITSITQNNNK